MGQMLLFFISFHIIIQVALSQYNVGMEGYDNKVWDFDDLSEKEEPLYKRYQSFEDGPPPPFPATDWQCHKQNMRCIIKLGNQGPICAHHPKYGLVTFTTECEVHLENCLINAYEKRTGQKSVKERYYYNNNRRRCQYYTSQTYTPQDAIKLYYMSGRVMETRRKAPSWIESDTELQTTTEKKLYNSIELNNITIVNK